MTSDCSISCSTAFLLSVTWQNVGASDDLEGAKKMKKENAGLLVQPRVQK